MPSIRYSPTSPHSRGADSEGSIAKSLASALASRNAREDLRPEPVAQFASTFHADSNCDGEK